LRDLGIGTNGQAIALPLASFNAGVEIGQMAVAALLVPVFWWLGARPTSRLRFAAAWSVMVIAAGSYWLVERIVFNEGTASSRRGSSGGGRPRKTPSGRG